MVAGLLLSEGGSVPNVIKHGCNPTVQGTHVRMPSTGIMVANHVVLSRTLLSTWLISLERGGTHQPLQLGLQALPPFKLSAQISVNHLTSHSHIWRGLGTDGREGDRLPLRQKTDLVL